MSGDDVKNKVINYITPKGYDRLVKERDHLQFSERPEMTKIVAWAASLGDRSENADYLYGKKRLREIDSRLRFLNTRINSSKVIDPAKQSGDVIRFGATVTLVDERGEEKKFCIVGIDEIKTEHGHISWRSPIGSALLSKKIDDTVKIQTPQGPVEFDIINVEYIELD